jgi:localization factor PodJL
VVQGLTDKLERLSLTRADHAAVTHLEDRIVKLVEKLDASDSRLSHLETIERGLAELLIHFEHSRMPQSALTVANAPEAAALKRDVQRTQESLEAVHGTIGHVVERLATIETGIRDLPKAANIPQAAPAGAALAAWTPKTAVPELAAPVGTRATAPAAPPGESQASVTAQNPAPADRKPIDPNLPPDHPLEPGAARGRGATPAERIAASEAALGNGKPPVIPDPGGKPNFIAAARRAAQAAIVDPPAPKTKRGGGDAKAAAEGSGEAPRRTMGQKVKALLVGASVVVIVVGTLQFALNLFSSSDPQTSDSSGTAAPAEEATPAPEKTATTPGRQSAVPLDRIGTPGTGVPASAALPSDNFTLAANTAAANTSMGETTGSVRAPSSQSASVGTAGVTPLPPAAPKRASGADKLPPGIGSGGLRAAAIKGDSAAEFEIATRYAEGRGVPQNLTEAAAWFERAAKQGLPSAQFRLGGLHEKGMGVPKSLETARRLYQQAAEAGHAKAMHNLAVLYAEGVAGKPDYQTASRWFRGAAEHGVSDSQYNLGVLYARGIGVETNMAEAYKWFALAGRAGDREAAKKRDDVGSRLDRQSLTAATQAVQAWQAQPQTEAVQVRVPSGGWDGVPAPAIVKRSVGPKIDRQ